MSTLWEMAQTIRDEEAAEQSRATMQTSRRAALNCEKNPVGRFADDRRNAIPQVFNCGVAARGAARS